MDSFRPLIAFTWPNGPILPEFTDLESSLEQMIGKASTRIDILTYSQNTDTRFNLNKSLEDAIKRNKPEINLYMHEEADAKRFKSSYKGIGSKIRCWYWDDQDDTYSKFHIKAILVDNFEIYIGSANLSKTAMAKSAECGLFFRNREITTSLRRYLEELIDAKRLIEV